MGRGVFVNCLGTLGTSLNYLIDKCKHDLRVCCTQEPSMLEQNLLALP